jgi:hypothetical protein
MRRQLIANGGSYQISAVRVEPLLHQQIDLSQVNQAQVDGDFFTFADLWLKFDYAHTHPYGIHMASIRHLYGW